MRDAFNMGCLEGSLERTDKTTHVVNLFYIPGGSKNKVPKPVNIFFTCESEAEVFTTKWAAYPEMAFKASIEDWDIVRNECVSFFEKAKESDIAIDYIISRSSLKFELGLDNLPYAIFNDNSYSYEYDKLVGEFGVGHWGSYENCVCLQQTIGM